MSYKVNTSLPDRKFSMLAYLWGKGLARLKAASTGFIFDKKFLTSIWVFLPSKTCHDSIKEIIWKQNSLK